MKKYMRWTIAVLVSPFVLFIILCILIYLPPIQNFLVDTATRYASEATGMQISISRISLKFPLDLVIHETTVVDKNDTILSAERLTAEVQFWPLLKQKVELDGLKLEQAKVNTMGLIEGMTLKGDLGEFFVASHGVELDTETAIVNKISLKDTHLSLSYADTTAADTTESSPLFWKIRLHEVDLQRVSFVMDMPLDTLRMALAVDKALLKNGQVDLLKEAYEAEHFSIESGKVDVDMDGNEIAGKGLDPMHIRITQLNTKIDSIRYAGTDIYAHIRDFTLKERSGLEVVSTEGILSADAKSLNIPNLRIKTNESDAELTATMDWDAADIDKEGTIRARLMANIGKGDVLKAVPDMPEEIVKSYPSAPLSIRAGIDGNLKLLKLTSFSVDMPNVFRAEATGQIAYPIDSVRREGSIELQAVTRNMNFLQSMTGGITIPSGMELDATASLKGNEMGANMEARLAPQGSMLLNGKFDMERETFESTLDIERVNIHDFMPEDSIFFLSASAKLEGKGMDIFSPKTEIHAQGNVASIQYGSQTFKDINLVADMANSAAVADLSVNDSLIQSTAKLTATLHPHQVKADLTADLQKLDLLSMGYVEKELTPSLHFEAHAETDMKNHHGLRAAVTDIHLKTEKQTFKTKDLHAGLELATDSLRSFVNAGDLTFVFRSETGLEKLMKDAEGFMTEISHEWEKKSINQKLLKELLPSARLRIFSGSDNPVANMLAINHVKYDKLNADIMTSPLTGINGDIDFFGLRTDSLRLDTICFKAEQDTANLYFHGIVKALANKQQEAFTASLDGNIGSTEALMRAEYLNGKGEKGVDLGLKAMLHPKGISLQITPENPILVYRPFTASKGNYVYLNDKGKIYADMKLYDENNTGLSLYASPDSLVMQDLTVGIHHLNIGEFKRVVPYMPDISGVIDAEAHYIQNTAEDMQVAIDLSTKDLIYNKQPLGNWGMNAVYLPGDNGEHCIDGFLTLDDESVMSWGGSYLTSAGEGIPDVLKAHMQLEHFPLQTANAFIPDRMALLGGDLDGNMSVNGSTDKPILNGTLSLDSVTLNIPQASLFLRFDNRPVNVVDSRLQFNNFSLFTKGKSPFTIDGTVDMTDLAALGIDLKMNARDFELINAKRTKESLVHGKLYVDFNSTLKGTPDALTMRGNMNILGKSDFTYILKDSPLTVEDRLGETVTFVDFRDTTQVAKQSTEQLSLGGIDMLMTMHIDEAVQARVDLNESGSNYMLLEGGGDLSFQYQPNGEMVLNGRYSLISGEMKYEMPVIPLKTFTIQEGSYIEWTGNMMNPLLNIKATERMRASVSTSSDNNSSRMVNFDVGVKLTNRLENLGLAFTLEAPDDGTMQNELASKSDEEKNKLAVTMLVTGMYMAEGNTGSGIDANSMLNSFLQGEINKVAGNALKSIDINFGMETSDSDNDGTSRTDYKLQFAKRFWNNRFQVVIGGKISTGNDVNQQQDEAFIDNISLEYRLDNSGTRYVKLFHDKNYESILDGEVIETGAGLVLRKKVSKLSELFLFRPKKKKKGAKNASQPEVQNVSATKNEPQTEPENETK